MTIAKKTASKAKRKKPSPEAKVDYVQVTCRQWLVATGYEDIAKLIDHVMSLWAEKGDATRRDWWLILAGHPDGRPRKVNGLHFPVLKAARRRQGFPPDVQGAIERSPHELAPSIKEQARWAHNKGFKRALT